jgi:hypothetical protein
MASIFVNHCDWRNPSNEQNGVMDCPLGRKMMMKVEQPALGDDLLARCASGAATYDRENRFFDEDFQELREAGRSCRAF